MKRLLLWQLLIFSLLTSVTVLAVDIKNIEQNLANHQKTTPKGDIKQITYVKKLIDYMYLFDQEIRNLLIKHYDNKKVELLIKNMDIVHTLKMREILKEWGWIVISKFGPEYDNKAWLIVQHADHDPFFQAGVLFLLESMAKQGETDKRNYAYLYDRVATKFNQIGIFQKYGTQVDINNAQITLKPYDGSLEEIDKRRKDVGLEPLQDYLKMIKEIYIPIP